MFTGYQGWVDGVAEWLDIDDTVTLAQVPNFIKLAENDLNRVARMKEQLRCVTSTIDSDGILTLPGDYGQMFSVNIEPSQQHLEVLTSYNFLNTAQRIGDGGGEPAYYSIFGEGIHFIPKGVNKTVKLWYFREVPHLAPPPDGPEQTIFTDYAAEALLAGACMHGSRYIVEDNRQTMFEEQFTKAVNAANVDAENDRMGSAPQRTRYDNKIRRSRRSFTYV